MTSNVQLPLSLECFFIKQMKEDQRRKKFETGLEQQNYFFQKLRYFILARSPILNDFDLANIKIFRKKLTD